VTTEGRVIRGRCAVRAGAACLRHAAVLSGAEHHHRANPLDFPLPQSQPPNSEPFVDASWSGVDLKKPRGCMALWMKGAAAQTPFLWGALESVRYRSLNKLWRPSNPKGTTSTGGTRSTSPRIMELRCGPLMSSVLYRWPLACLGESQRCMHVQTSSSKAPFHAIQP
jgi:hypothetical protein